MVKLIYKCRLVIQSKRIILLTLSILCVFTVTSLRAQMSSVVPLEYTEGMTNPLMGFRNNTPVAKSNLPYITLVRKYIEYNALDNSVSDGVQKIINYTNVQFAGYEDYNVKVIPRVILMWDDALTHFPSDIPYTLNAWSSEQLKVRVQDFIARLGQAWDNDPRIAFIEVGLIGRWGEQEGPVGINEAIVGSSSQTWSQIIGPAFKNAFHNKKCMVRSMHKWQDDLGAGVYWDSYGAIKRMTGTDDDYQQVLLWNRVPYERYKTAPMQGEVAYSQSDPAHIGLNSDETVQNTNYRQWFIDNIRSMHSTTCGLEYDGNNSANSVGASIIQKSFGYRFLIKQFECTGRTEPGGDLNIVAKILNDGSAPIYENWPLAVVLIDETTKQIVHKSIIPSVDITKWLPGSNYDWTPQVAPSFGTGTRQYLTPAVENTLDIKIQIPSTLKVGQYLVGLSILDPTNHLPAVYFSVKNYLKTSNTQPLCRIGVGTDASGFVINSTLFDNYDWRAGDVRKYSKTYIPMSVAGVNVSSTLGVMKTKTKQLVAGVIPTYAADKSVVWTSSNNDVATVSSSGLITGVSVGVADISVTTVDGGFKSTCVVNVSEFIPCDVPWSKTNFTLTATGIKTYSSGVIDISCEDIVTLSMDLQEITGLESLDILKVSYILDGTEVVLANLVNDFTSKAINVANIHGDKIEIIVKSTLDGADESYQINNLKITATGVSGISRAVANNFMNVSPNPVSSVMVVEHPINSIIRIYNTQGQIVYTRFSEKDKTEINVSEVNSTGLVFVNVTAGDESSTRKVFIKR